MFSANRTSSTSRRARIISLGRAIDNTVEALESRWLFSVTATSGGGVLTVTGDNNANAIRLLSAVRGEKYSPASKQGLNEQGRLV